MQAPSQAHDGNEIPLPRRARILLVENTVRGLGGSYESLFLTAKALPRDRFEPIVLFFQESHFARKLRDLGVRVIVEKSRRFWETEAYKKNTEKVRGALPRKGFLGRIRKTVVSLLRGLLGGIPMAWTVWRTIRREKIDLLHSNNNLQRDVMVILGGVLARVPIVVHERQLIPCSFLAARLSRRVHTLVCISDAVHAFTLSSGAKPIHRVRVHNGIDLSAMLDVRPELPPGPRRVGIIGRIMPRKGQKFFLEAVSRLHREFPDIEAYVIGRATGEDAPYEEELRELCRRLGIEHSVRWTGYRDDPLGLIASLDVAVHATIEPEPFGRVIIEALALGVPAVATALGGPLEIIEDGVSGYLVPPGDPDTLAARVGDLLRDRSLADRIRAEGRRRVEEKFGLDPYILSMVGIYEQALAGTESRSSPHDGSRLETVR